MLKVLDISKKKSIKSLEMILKKRKSSQNNNKFKIKRILDYVRKNGDNALIKYEKKFSKIKINSKKIKFSKTEINNISKKIDKKLKKSIDLAYGRIKKFHSKQKFSSFRYS